MPLVQYCSRPSSQDARQLKAETLAFMTGDGEAEYLAMAELILELVEAKLLQRHGQDYLSYRPIAGRAAA